MFRCTKINSSVVNGDDGEALHLDYRSNVAKERSGAVVGGEEWERGRRGSRHRGKRRCSHDSRARGERSNASERRGGVEGNDEMAWLEGKGGQSAGEVVEGEGEQENVARVDDRLVVCHIVDLPQRGYAGW